MHVYFNFDLVILNIYLYYKRHIVNYSTFRDEIIHTHTHYHYFEGHMGIFSTVQIFLDTCGRNQKKIILKIWSLTQATAFTFVHVFCISIALFMLLSTL